MPTTCDESEHGDAEFRALFEEIYSELHAIAERHARRNRPDHTLQATALVHEAYVKLSQRPRRVYRDLIHFRATAARAIRHILVNHEKARRTKKRGGGMQRIALDERVVGSSETDLDLLALDDALSQLAEIDDRQCRVVELRYFGGLTVSEIAAELELSTRTIEGDWATARAWLSWRLGQESR